MTKREVERALRVWTDRLGLSHWDIRIDWETPAHEDSDAGTWRANQYDRAVMFLAPEWREWNQKRMNQLLVHELLHLYVRDVDVVLDVALTLASSAAREQLESRYFHEVEGLVDRLANRFVEIGGLV